MCGSNGPHDRLAREAGLHSDLVARCVRLGLVDPADQAVRLRRDLGVGSAGAVACRLPARIDELR